MKTIVVFALACLTVGAQNYFFRTDKIEAEGKPVTGAPYSADAVTETTQVLADGNRISRSSTAHVARDSMGRTRREQNLKMLGPWPGPGNAPSFIMINDPVGGVHYTLDTQAKTAMKMPVPALNPEEVKRMDEMKARAMTKQENHVVSLAIASPDGVGGGVGGATVWFDAADSPQGNQTPPKIESLGNQEIEGVQAEGKRVTETIPAGKIGNERPIEIVNETWYSPELQLTVMSRHSDPRTGDVTYKLTHVDRSEPPATLFQVPADYKLQEGGAKVMRDRAMSTMEVVRE